MVSACASSSATSSCRSVFGTRHAGDVGACSSKRPAPVLGVQDAGDGHRHAAAEQLQRSSAPPDLRCFADGFEIDGRRAQHLPLPTIVTCGCVTPSGSSGCASIGEPGVELVLGDASSCRRAVRRRAFGVLAGSIAIFLAKASACGRDVSAACSVTSERQQREGGRGDETRGTSSYSESPGAGIRECSIRLDLRLLFAYSVPGSTDYARNRVSGCTHRLRHGRNAVLPLTKRQREILDYLNEFIQQHGYAPSLEEIGRRFNLSSLATVHKHLTNLQEKGFIRRAWNRSRSVELVPTRVGGRALELPLLGFVAAGAPDRGGRRQRDDRRARSARRQARQLRAARQGRFDDRRADSRRRLRHRRGPQDRPTTARWSSRSSAASTSR